MDYFRQAREAVQRLHQCDAVHVETVRVREQRGGQVLWDADVEVFALEGFAQANCCYVWGYKNEQRGGELDFISVPAVHPIKSASEAVLAVVEWEARKSRA